MDPNPSFWSWDPDRRKNPDPSGSETRLSTDPLKSGVVVVLVELHDVWPVHEPGVQLPVRGGGLDQHTGDTRLSAHTRYRYFTALTSLHLLHCTSRACGKREWLWETVLQSRSRPLFWQTWNLLDNRTNKIFIIILILLKTRKKPYKFTLLLK